MFKKLSQSVMRFLRVEHGTMTVEAALIFPLLTWAMAATFVYFDAFRAKTTAMKSAYTISDALSRQTSYITPNYLNGIFQMQEMLTISNYDTQLRMTVIGYRAVDDKYMVRWSRGINGLVPLVDADLVGMRTRIPVMPDGEIVILVENRMSYEPVFSVGLTAFDFTNFVITRPRMNTNQLCFNTVENGNNSTATC